MKSINVAILCLSLWTYNVSSERVFGRCAGLKMVEQCRNAISVAGTPRKLDEYGALNCEDEMARLDSYAISLHNDPEAQAYMIVYGGQRGRRGEVQARMARIRYYLINTRLIQAERLIIVHGGYRRNLMVELWLKSRTDPAPLATPTIQPRDVRFRRGRMERWEYDCSELG